AYLFVTSDIRTPVRTVPAGTPNPVVRISALEIAARNPPGTTIGVDERVITGDSLIANPKPVTTLGVDGWLSVPVAFTPQAGKTYYIEVTANAFNGDKVSRLLTLIAR